jgi:hypothetical protein
MNNSEPLMSRSRTYWNRLFTSLRNLRFREFWDLLLDRSNTRADVRLGLEQLEARLVPASYTVTDQASLQSALTAAMTGLDKSNTITLGNSINLSSPLSYTADSTKLLILDGAGNTLSGEHEVRPLVIGPDTNAVLENVTITAGRAVNNGSLAGVPATTAVGGGVLNELNFRKWE